MSLVNIIMPKLGESIMEATVLKWHKKVGDMVTIDENLLDIATDKVDSEVPSTAEGVLEEILFRENEVVPIGSVIARVRTKVADDNVEMPPTSSPIDQPEPQHKFADDHLLEQAAEAAVPFIPSSNEYRPKSESVRFYSPLVMNIASREGIEIAELNQITGTGNDGRVSKRDILNYIENKRSGSFRNKEVTNGTSANNGAHSFPKEEIRNISAAPPSHHPQYSNNVEVVEMDRMRKLISDHMRKSLDTSAHVTSFAEADVTNLVKWREKVKKEFEKRENEKFTLTPIFIEAIAKCIRKYPMLNASVDGERILLKKDVNIGMATALPNGNLIVPVIKYADQLSMIGLAKHVNRLANLARNGQLHPSDIQDGSFTFTNIGTFGSLMGTPIINQPQVGILATGAIKKKPVVMESEKGDSIAIRHMMFVSLSYDHRIIDGGLGSLFLSAFVNELESFDLNRSI
ncbi:MAG: 2-oxo acid dehydrogenase subunit E2 [Chitinophagia bacterium]|nr:2-oxo acid dehydrogenase subunit E2 [Chitinophagia bacterium]